MLRHAGGIFAGMAVLTLSNCGTVLWTETNEGPPGGDIDGAVLTYALADGDLSVQGEIKSGALTITTDQKVAAKPDVKKIYHVIYSHSGFSDDDINIQLDGALVKSISSTTTDRTVQIVQGVTSLLTQVSATQTAIEKAARPQAVPAPTPPCKDMQATYIENITHNSGKRFVTKSGGDGCNIHFEVTANLASPEYLGVKAFARAEDNVEPDDVCHEYAFCFRMGAIYKIKIRAWIVKGKNEQRLSANNPTISIPPFTVAAPVRGHLGYVRFDRRAFVSNKASLTFDANGLVSTFAATNPSEVLGFIVLPTAVAAGIAAGVALHH